MYPGTVPPRYIYPDGNYSGRKPKDGEVFSLIKNGATESTWQWDGFVEQWFNVSSGKPSKVNTATFALPPVHFDPVTVDSKSVWGESTKKCQCGSHKVNSQKHSDWCDLYDPRN